MTESQRLRMELSIFILWACVFGIMVPLLCAVISDVVFKFLYSKPEQFAFGTLYYLLFLVTICVALGGPIVALFKYLPATTNESSDTNSPSPTTARTWLYATGIITAVLMGIAVMFTGGPLDSPFCFYLLYLPSVTAVAFTPSPSTRVKAQGVLIVGILCGAFLLGGVLWSYTPQHFEDNFLKSAVHKVWYCLIVVIQLLSIVLIERGQRARAKA